MSFTTGQRLSYLRHKNNLTQLEFAQKINERYGAKINKGMVSKWENDREVPSSQSFRLIANFYRVTVDLFLMPIETEKSFENLYNLVFSDDPENISDIIPANLTRVDTNSENVQIPVLGEIACGEPITAEENIEEYRNRAKADLPEGVVFYLKTKGDSMSPTITSGSYVLIKEQPDVESGEIAAVLVNGDTEATLKRVKKQGNIVLLVPDNPEYDTYVITDQNPARILGKAIEVTTTLQHKKYSTRRKQVEYV